MDKWKFLGRIVYSSEDLPLRLRILLGSTRSRDT